jgi:hypothetical protein
MGETVTLVFLGRLDPASFAEFAGHRAARLSLGHSFGRMEPGCVEVTVSGDADLIDAFEMACSLGPIDCLVRGAYRA